MEKAKTRNLLRKWNKVINLPGAKAINESKKSTVALMFENQIQFQSAENNKNIITESSMDFGNHVSVSDVNTYDTRLIPLLRRIAPDLIALDILGSQPMEKPVQLIFAMRSHYAGNDSGNNAFPLPGAGAGNNRLPYDQTPNSLAVQYYEMVQVTQVADVNVTAQLNKGAVVSNDWAGGSQTKFAMVLEATVEKDTGTLTILLERLDSGKKSHRQLGSGYDPTLLTEFFTASDKIVPDMADPTWTEEPVVFFDLPDEGLYNAVLDNYSGTHSTSVSEGMGKEINQMNFSIDKVNVEARTRILKARYSFEVAEDLKAYHGLDAENELVNILSYEILAEMNREIVNHVRLASIHGGTRGYNYKDVDGRMSMERFRTLYNLINKVANEIAISTRRGNGNFIICSMDVKVALESMDGYELWTDVNTDFNANGAVAYAGTLAGKYKVYIDTFATKDFAIVGYKGNSEMDAGLFYCPYVPLNMVKAVGQDDFQPRIGFRTRYGIGENPFGAKLYYRYIGVDGLSYAYGDGPIGVKMETII